MTARRTLARQLLCLSMLGAFLAACSPTGGGNGNRKKSKDDDPAATCADADGDGISDADEGRAEKIDTDGDGVPDYLDDDSDNDGIPDRFERFQPCKPPVDSDGDGIPDFRDTDSDNNGRPDGVDGADDLDGDGIPDFQDDDDDGDGIPDVLELGDDPLNPVDTDGDGIPDFQDTDSDGDTISDADEGEFDADGDGVPNFRDLDSDGDCIPDSIEAGDGDPSTRPVDSDGDGAPDFLDIDSDDDGVPDGQEDQNCNGVLDPGESDPKSQDTDGDGVTDLVESVAGTDPNDPADNPQAHGDFFFVVPYEKPASPDKDTLDFATKIVNADVFFLMDTTGSMGGEIGNLKNSLKTIAAQLRTEIPNIAFGVGEYRDFPTGNYGSSGDQPFRLRHRVMTVNTDPGLTSVQGAVNQLVHGGGNDGPESGWEALFQVATGNGINVGGANVPAFNPVTAQPMPPPAGEKIGDIGGVGFRSGSLPIIVQVTDAPSHNSDGADPYNFSGPATRSSAIAALNAIGAKVLAVVSTGGVSGAKNDATHGVRGTGALVPPDAWGAPGAGRPANCNANQCCTGEGGKGEAPDGSGMCALTFTVDSNGNGLGDSAVTAIKALTNYATIDISAIAADDPSDAVDAVSAFVERLEANASAGAPCVSGLAVEARSGSVPDTFVKVMPGTQVCFDVIPKSNTMVPPTQEPQVFKANITVIGDNVTELDTRTIYFLVPPELPDIIVR